jgi:aminopeptidase N
MRHVAHRLAIVSSVALAFGCTARNAPSGSPHVPPARGDPPRATHEIALERCATDTTDVLHHAVDLSLALVPPKLAAHGEIRVRARRATEVIALDADDLRVLTVTSPSGPVRFHHARGVLCVALEAPLRAGSEITLQMDWEVPTSAKIPTFRPGEAWAGYRASAWMPTRQDPAQRATLRLSATVDAGVKFAASGDRTVVAALPNGQIHYTFVLERPSPPFLYAFAAGNYAESTRTIGAVTLRALAPKGAAVARALDVTATMYGHLTARIGAPLPSKEYVQVFVGADMQQEAAGMAILAAEALDDLQRDPTDDWLFSHELAHQWFAWLVPCRDFTDFWLNEGLATFLVAVLKKEMHGRAAYETEIANWRARSRKVHDEGRDAPIAAMSTEETPAKVRREADLPPRGVTYFRGALVLHKLEQELGERVFWEGIQRYVRDRAGKGARTEHLREALASVSGRDLKDFFARWVYAAAPEL